MSLQKLLTDPDGAERELTREELDRIGEELSRMPPLPETKTEMIDYLADIEHRRWADWQRYLHDQCDQQEDGSLVIPAQLVARWNRQIETPYTDLPNVEKSSDRNEVYRYWSAVRAFFERRGADGSLD